MKTPVRGSIRDGAAAYRFDPPAVAVPRPVGEVSEKSQRWRLFRPSAPHGENDPEGRPLDDDANENRFRAARKYALTIVFRAR